MLIKNTTASPIGCPIDSTPTSRRVFLKPGVNDIPPLDWEKLRKNPQIARKIAAGKIVEPSAEEKKSGSPVAGPVIEFSKLKEKEALALVEETVDPSLLSKWFETERRVKVAKALEKKLELVTRPGNDTPKGGLTGDVDPNSVGTGEGAGAGDDSNPPV